MFQLRVRGLEPDWRLVWFRPNVRLTELDFRVSQAYYVNIPRQNLSTAFQARVRGLESDWKLVRFCSSKQLTELDIRVGQAYYVNIPWFTYAYNRNKLRVEVLRRIRSIKAKTMTCTINGAHARFFESSKYSGANDEVILCGYPSLRVPGARDDQRSPKINRSPWRKA